MPTIQQQLNQLKKDKETLNTMLNTMGVETTGNETFTQLTPLVGKIVSDPILQDKSITITENGTQTITADEGYDGLNSVEVVTNVASSGGSGELATGIVVSELNENGLPKTITINNATVPDYCFYGNSATSSQNILTTNLEKLIFKNTLKTGSYICSNCINLKEVIFDDTLEEIETYAFFGCSNANFQFLENSNLKAIREYAFRKSSGISYIPESVTTLEIGAYYQTTNNTIKTIPDSITELSESLFKESDITQMSMNNVTLINGGASTRGTFNGTKSLKALWIGSEIITIGRYALNNSTVTKIFIDRPKAGIENLTYYSTKWSNNTLSSDCQIIGNDEEGFMTKEQFDSIDWATYTV